MDNVRRVEKPWGFELWWAVTELYAGKILHVEQGRRLSVQYHREKDESCYVLSGRVRVIKGPSLARLGAWDVAQGGVWRPRCRRPTWMTSFGSRTATAAPTSLTRHGRAGLLPSDRSRPPT